MQVDIDIHKQNISITRQRNFFAGCMGLAVITSFLLAGKISSTTERVIMVPGITRYRVRRQGFFCFYRLYDLLTRGINLPIYH